MANDQRPAIIEHWLNKWLELQEDMTCVPAMPRSAASKFRIERNKDASRITVKQMSFNKTVKQLDFPNTTQVGHNLNDLDGITNMDIALLQVAVETTLEVY